MQFTCERESRTRLQHDNGLQDAWLDEDIQPLALTEPEIDDVVASLASLTSPQCRERGMSEPERQRALSRTSRPQRDTKQAFSPRADESDAARRRCRASPRMARSLREYAEGVRPELRAVPGWVRGHGPQPRDLRVSPPTAVLFLIHRRETESARRPNGSTSSTADPQEFPSPATAEISRQRASRFHEHFPLVKVSSMYRNLSRRQRRGDSPTAK